MRWLPALALCGAMWAPAQTYEEMRRSVLDLYREEKFAEAAAILQKAMEEYPAQRMANSYNLALMYTRLRRPEEAARVLSSGLDHGIFYSKWGFNGTVWEPLRRTPAFAAVSARNEAAIRAAEKRTAMKWEVSQPRGYDPSRKYPLFLALHGGGENVEQFRPNWTSPRLREEFLVAYVQSSQVASMDGFHWQDVEITKKELQRAYAEISAKYAVNGTRVYVGGFSSGGFATLTAVFDEVVPARGFVILCPELAPEPDAHQLAGLLRRGVRGTLITTEQDNRIEKQKLYAAALQAKGLDLRLIVRPNIDHWFPPDFGDLLDAALAHIDR
jgi:predicted esterase